MTQVACNVRDYGATGDGVTKDTACIQRAIDACAAQGGGRVVIPAGRYLSGTLYLKSHIELHLSAGAELLGSPDQEDYNADDIFPENEAFTREKVSAAHLIIAYRQEHVLITGSGIINGNSLTIFDPLPEGVTATYRFRTGHFPRPDWRPGQMIFFCRCKQVAVRDITLRNSPYWNLFLLGCEDVQIQGITIENPPATPNGDGIDIDCCRRVIVSGCNIRSGDDCITLRANIRKLGEEASPCEDIIVSNCVLSSATCAFRIGVGDGEIRRCSINNIVVTQARTAININARYSPHTHHGVCIEQIHFSNFVIDCVMPIVVTAGTEAMRPAAIRDISFSHFSIRATAGSQIVGSAQVPIERVRFTDIDWHLYEGTENCEFVDQLPDIFSVFGYRGTGGLPALPCALYGESLQDIRFNNVRLNWENLSPVWRDGIYLHQADLAEFEHVRMRQPQPLGGTALRCEQVGAVVLHGCRAELGTETFLRTARSPNGARLSCTGNDFSLAESAFDTDMVVHEAGNIWRVDKEGL